LVNIKIFIKNMAFYHLSQQTMYLREFPLKYKKYKKKHKKQENLNICSQKNEIFQCQVNKFLKFYFL